MSDVNRHWVRDNITLFATLLFGGAEIVRGHRMLGHLKKQDWRQPTHEAAPQCFECVVRPGTSKLLCEDCLFVRDEIWSKLSEPGKRCFWEFLAFRAEPAGAHTSVSEARPPEHWE